MTANAEVLWGATIVAYVSVIILLVSLIRIGYYSVQKCFGMDETTHSLPVISLRQLHIMGRHRNNSTASVASVPTRSVNTTAVANAPKIHTHVRTMSQGGASSAVEPSKNEQSRNDSRFDSRYDSRFDSRLDSIVDSRVENKVPLESTQMAKHNSTETSKQLSTDNAANSGSAKATTTTTAPASAHHSGASVSGVRQSAHRDRERTPGSRDNSRRSVMEYSGKELQSSYVPELLRDTKWCCLCQACCIGVRYEGTRLLCMAVTIVSANLVWCLLFGGILFSTITPVQYFTEAYCHTLYTIFCALYGLQRVTIIWFFTYRLQIVFHSTIFGYKTRFLRRIRFFATFFMILTGAFAWFEIFQHSDPEYTTDGNVMYCVPSGDEWSMNQSVLWFSVVFYAVMDVSFQLLVLHLFVNRLWQFLNHAEGRFRSITEEKSAHERRQQMLNMVGRSFVLAVVSITSTILFVLSAMFNHNITYFVTIDGVLNATCVLCLFPPFRHVYSCLFQRCQQPMVQCVNFLCSRFCDAEVDLKGTTTTTLKDGRRSYNEEAEEPNYYDDYGYDGGMDDMFL